MKNKKYYLFEMDMLWLQIMSTVLLALFALITYFIYPNISISNDTLGISFILIIPYMILHEIFHSISYVINGADFKNITYGSHLEKGILCCLCKQNISKRNILISLLTPFFIIGIITYIIGILTSNSILTILSIFNLSGCSGDLIMFISLSKLKNFEFSEYDNPIAFGLYSEQDLSKRKLLGLKYIEEVDGLDKEDLKKITISKGSIYTFFAYLLLGVFLMRI